MSSTKINLGKVALTPKGEWNAATTYERLDVVSYQGSSYTVLKECIGQTPSEGEYYSLLASKGAKGDKGDSFVPQGGTVGQILSKKSATEGDTEWIDPPETGVTSFNGRKGVIAPAEGDYTPEMVGAASVDHDHRDLYVECEHTYDEENTVITRSTDKIYVNFRGHSTISGSPSHNNPATITGVPFIANATSPTNQSRSIDLGVIDYSLSDELADSYDGRSGELTRRIGRLEFKGDENIVQHPNIPGCFCLNGRLPGDAAFPFSGLSTHFIARDDLANLDGFTITVDHQLCFRSASFNGYNVDSIKSWLAMQDAAGTPVVFYYKLTEPIVTLINGDIQAFDGTTTITGANSIGVVDDRIIRFHGKMPFEIENNINQLDNYYFLDTINTRSENEYTVEGEVLEYTIDRWMMHTAKLTLDGSKVLLLENLDGSTARNVICQHIESPDRFSGMTLTFSILVKNVAGSVCASAFAYDRNIRSDIFNVVGSPISTNGVSSVTFNIPPNTPITEFRVHILLSGGGSCTPIATKLELGSHQTLAHKEGDVWVLNDPPPNKALELAKCQRYCVKIPKHIRCAGTVNSNGTSGEFFIPTPMSIRANPSNIGIKFVHHSEQISVFESAVFTYIAAENGIIVGFSGASGLQPRSALTVYTDSSGVFSADL